MMGKFSSRVVIIGDSGIVVEEGPFETIAKESALFSALLSPRTRAARDNNKMIND